MQVVHLVLVELTNHSLQNHVTWILQGMIGQFKSQGELFAQFTNNKNGCYITTTVKDTVNK